MDFLSSLIFIIILAPAAAFIILFFIIRAICNYLARKTAEEIDKRNREFWRYQCSQLSTAIAMKMVEFQQKEKEKEKEPSAE